MPKPLMSDHALSLICVQMKAHVVVWWLGANSWPGGIPRMRIPPICILRGSFYRAQCPETPYRNDLRTFWTRAGEGTAAEVLPPRIPVCALNLARTSAPADGGLVGSARQYRFSAYPRLFTLVLRLRRRRTPSTAVTPVLRQWFVAFVDNRPAVRIDDHLPIQAPAPAVAWAPSRQ